MTPEQRFFPARDDDELRVHDDFLAAHGDDPRGEVLRAHGTPAGQDIGKALKTVHGKNDRLPFPATARSFQTRQFLISVLCALLVHALAFGVVGTWLGSGGKGAGGPMLMALELSSGGSGAAVSGEGPSASAGSSMSPKGEFTAPQSLASAVAQALSGPASSIRVQDRENPPPVPATKKNEPTPIAQAPARPSAPVKPQPEQTVAQTPGPVQIAQEADTPQVASAASAARDENPDQDSARAGNGPSETPGPQFGAASHQQGAGSGSGAPGKGPLGTAGQGGGEGAPGGPGSGGSLIQFGTPGGPGIVRMTQPRYPQEAKRLGKEGVVVMKLSLDETGAVYEVEVLQGAGFGMDEASREAVMLSRFRPATAKGKTVACQAILPIHFKLR